MAYQNVADLIGESASLQNDELPAHVIDYIPPVQLGDGLAGPANDQQFAIYRDTRPIQADELQDLTSPTPHLGIVARHRAGRSFPLNYTWGPAGFDFTLPGMVPLQNHRRMSPLSPGGLPRAHDGFKAPEVLKPRRTIFYTSTKHVGWR